MKSSLRDLLSWVWQVVLSWLAAIATGIDLPLCLERSTKMVVKVNDPEMAVGRHAEKEEEAMVKKEPPGVLLTEEEEVSETLLKSDDHEVSLPGQTMIGDDERTRMVEFNAEEVDQGSDETSEDTSSLSSTTSTLSDSDNDIGEANAASPDIVEEDGLPFPEEIDMGNAVNEEENVNSRTVEDLAEAAANGDESHNAEENGEPNSSRLLRNDINENDEVDDEDYEEEVSAEISTAVDTSVTWLMELGSKDTYQKVLSPQYYCLNFRTLAPLQSGSVNTAIKQLRSLLPWLGFGLKQQNKDMWLCLYPEDKIYFQTADSDDSLWDVLSNCQNQFDYIENKCLCSFVFMKAYPCTQCQALCTQTQTSPGIAAKDSVSSSTEVTVNTSTANCSTAPLAGATISGVSTTVGKDTCGDTGSSQDENVSGAFGTTSDTGAVSDSSIVPTTIPATSAKSDTSSTSPLEPVISSDSVTEQDTCTLSSYSCTLVKNPADSTPASVVTVEKEKTFSFNYRLVFGVPRPLADETSVEAICDTFLKELDAVIKKAAAQNLMDTEKKDAINASENEAEKKDSVDASDVASENEADKKDAIDISEVANENEAERKDSINNGEIAGENEAEKKDSVDTSEIAQDNEAENGESSENVENSRTSETESSSSNDQIDRPQCDNAAVTSDNDACEAVVANTTCGQVDKDMAQQEGATKSDITQEDIIAKNKASVQQQFTVLANILANQESKDADKNTSDTNKNNNEKAINRNSPHVDRTIEYSTSRNFVNKCKGERVSFISGFAVCVNEAVVNTLVKWGVKEENEDMNVGLRFSQYYNSLEDLSDHEWHDHDPVENDEDEDYDDDDSQDGRNAVCCRKPTANLNGRATDWHNHLWERVRVVERKRRDMLSEGGRSPSQIIPLAAEREINNNEKFPSICQPSADLSVSNISDFIPRFPRLFDNIESVTLQKLSPHIMFFMTNSISLCCQSGNLRFSFYHEGRFVPHDTAHQYADEIVSALNRSLVS